MWPNSRSSFSSGHACMHTGKNNTIVGNQIEHTRIGISIELSSSTNTVSENRIAGDLKGTGIKISSGVNNTFARNSIKSAQTGIDVHSSNNNSIEDNLIYGCNQHACKLTGSGFNNITNNRMCSSDYGIETDAQSNNNNIYHNDFHNNSVQAHEAGTNQWDNGTAGNYWSDYSGVDEHKGPKQDTPGGDGIGDTPHHEDRYPLVVPRSPIPVFYTVFHAYAPYKEEIRCDCCVSAGNMTISRFGFNRTTESIVYDVTISSETCYCNITVPKQLFLGAFEVYVNGTAIPCMVDPDKNCCYIYFNSNCFEFSEHSTYRIKINAEVAIPLTGDVNNDGLVDIFDVVMVSLALGDSS